jgi:hypothetical protein
MKSIFFCLIACSIVFSSCQKDEEDLPEPVFPLFLIIVDNSLYDGISGKLTTYVSETARGDSSAKVIQWSGTSAVQLRDTIESYFSRYQILGAVLIGNLPYVRYEMDNWDKHEEFPCDLFYASPSTNWFDDDSDGNYDRNSGNSIRYFISRIQGTTSEINTFFNKAHDYRAGYSAATPKKALLFIDNDWSDFYASEKFNLNNIYSVVDVIKDTNLTTRQQYVDYLSSGGAEYVMQLIHASYEKLYIQHLGSYQYVTQSDLVTLNPKARFYNLFNCSACNFEYDNLGMYYVMKTSYGLAVMGTTKTGGNYYPQTFNNALAEGKTWGEAWVKWWNTGASSLESKWTMGLVLFGDPMLKVNRTATKSDVVNESTITPAPDRMMYTR